MITESDLLTHAREALAHHEAEEEYHADKATRLRRVIAILEGKADPPIAAPVPPWISPAPWQVTPGIVGPWTPSPWPYGEIICGDPPGSIDGSTITYDPSGGVATASSRR